jgi:peptidoglycan/LPS O-acetylase OafA/YrhL
VLRRCRPAAGRGRGLLLAAGVATLGYAAQVVWQLWLRAATEVTTSRMLYPPDTRSLSILLGCALALVLAARGTRRLPAELPGAGPVALLSVAVLVWLFHDAHLGRSVADLLPLVVVAVASLSLVASLVLAPPTALAVRALGSRPMAWLGRASYSCYLWHEVAYRLAEQVSPRGTPVAEVLRFALALSLAAASYELVERPTQRWWVQRSRREERQPERPPVSAGAVAAGASR